MQIHSTDDKLERAAIAFRHKDYVTAAEVYGQLASDGHTESMVMLGWLQLNGLGVTRDEAKAIESFQRAAGLGSAIGNFYYGRYLTRIAKHAEAFPHYRVAAGMGHMPSTFWVGYMAARGHGIKQDLPLAYRFLILAAKRGHMHALREVAVLDIRGHRGFVWRLLAPAEFTVAVIGAFVVGLFAAESDLLRA